MAQTGYILSPREALNASIFCEEGNEDGTVRSGSPELQVNGASEAIISGHAHKASWLVDHVGRLDSASFVGDHAGLSEESDFAYLRKVGQVCIDQAALSDQLKSGRYDPITIVRGLGSSGETPRSPNQISHVDESRDVNNSPFPFPCLEDLRYDEGTPVTGQSEDSFLQELNRMPPPDPSAVMDLDTYKAVCCYMEGYYVGDQWVSLCQCPGGWCKRSRYFEPNPDQINCVMAYVQSERRKLLGCE